MLPAPSQTLNIALVGASGTGKSTLAKALLSPLQQAGLDAAYGPEPARDYFALTGTYEHWLENMTLFVQTVLQEEGLQVHEAVVYDSASFIQLAYMQFYRPPDLTPAQQLKWEHSYRVLHDATRNRFGRFAHIVLVPARDFDLGRDATRFNAADRQQLTDFLRSFLVANGVPFQELQRVGVKARTQEVLEELCHLGLLSEVPPIGTEEAG